MSDRLLPEGRLLLSLNKQPDGNEYDDVLKAFFESREGVVTGKRIIFTCCRVEAHGNGAGDGGTQRGRAVGHAGGVASVVLPFRGPSI